ncbi:integrase [Elizabethkingia anophelis]|uniref:tyrosine-type recombinase/integrase n=1 Tax=Elizabethkingia anophelis TaxID=1117645 RepID=UPI0021A7C1E8|nr:site-specific integrase [Elizabethkingia anophelis]MCT3947627.1 site-specific integrase [Elizabethkingia anophelis]MDV3574587.1 integrase [Elizabethkingia anophelis]MDV3597899.1 integrase [Elizabethkingia anophelis]MDV3607415.1 integrase [Elizabethkingia anophelis]
MKIHFNLNNKGAYKNIFINLIYDNNEYIFRTPLKIDLAQWDIEKQRPKNIYTKTHKQINNKINALKIELTGYIEQKNKHKNTISHKTIANIIRKTCKDNKENFDQDTLLSFIYSYINKKKSSICNSTYKRYNVFLNLIKRFEGFIMKRLTISEIDAYFMERFIAYGKDEAYSENTIYRTIHFIKTILNFIERKGIRTAVRELDIKREKQKKEMISLDEKEISQIKSTQVPMDLQPAKDWLIISCYTGQRFSDFIMFSNHKLIEIGGKKCIRFVQQKTQKEITLPLHPEVVSIIHKNQNQFPEYINMNRYNESIKIISKLAGMTQTVRVRRRIDHKYQAASLEKWETISSHIGRRSFATNFYGKIPTPLLMEATGHSTEKIFLQYINPVNEERVNRLSYYFNKTHRERLNI